MPDNQMLSHPLSGKIACQLGIRLSNLVFKIKAAFCGNCRLQFMFKERKVRNLVLSNFKDSLSDKKRDAIKNEVNKLKRLNKELWKTNNTEELAVQIIGMLITYGSLGLDDVKLEYAVRTVMLMEEFKKILEEIEE
jgi:hypothetical protein